MLCIVTTVLTLPYRLKYPTVLVLYATVCITFFGEQYCIRMNIVQICTQNPWIAYSSLYTLTITIVLLYALCNCHCITWNKSTVAVGLQLQAVDYKYFELNNSWGYSPNSNLLYSVTSQNMITCQSNATTYAHAESMSTYSFTQAWTHRHRLCIHVPFFEFSFGVVPNNLASHAHVD